MPGRWLFLGLCYSLKTEDELGIGPTHEQKLIIASPCNTNTNRYLFIPY